MIQVQRIAGMVALLIDGPDQGKESLSFFVVQGPQGRLELFVVAIKLAEEVGLIR